MQVSDPFLTKHIVEPAPCISKSVILLSAFKARKSPTNKLRPCSFSFVGFAIIVWLIEAINVFALCALRPRGMTVFHESDSERGQNLESNQQVVGTYIIM